MNTGLISFVVPGQPVAKARTRSVPLMRNGKPVLGAGGRPIVTNYTPKRTVSYEGLVRFTGKQAMGSRPLLEGPLAMNLYIDMQIPESKSQKWKRAALAGMQRPTTKPDLSNVVKALEDGLNGVVYADDKQIVEMSICKRYAATPGVRVDVWQLDPQSLTQQELTS